MKEIKGRKFTAEQFMGICVQALPHLKELERILRENEVTETTRIYIGADGYVNMDGGFDGWQLARYSNERGYVADYEYRERHAVEDGTNVRGAEDEET